jgi:hypothetical protein
MSRFARSWTFAIAIAVAGVLAAALLVLVFVSSGGAGSEARDRGRTGAEPAPERPRALGRDRPHDLASDGQTQPAPPSFATPWLAGRIVDLDSGPLLEGRVALHCEDGSRRASAAIDEEGEFVGPACPSGPTCVRLIHPGFEQPQAWELPPGSKTELEVSAAPGLSGTIVGSDGAPVPGASLLIRRGATSITTSSDAAGEFAVALPRQRPCDRCDLDASRCRSQTAAEDHDHDHDHAVLLAWADAHAPTQFDLPLAPEPVELALSPAAPPLSGRVVGSDGAPFDARTRVLASNLARADEQHSAPVDERGWFSFDSLAEADYSLRAIRDEREIASLSPARPGEPVELRSVAPAQGFALIIEVLDANGDPAAGVRLDGGPLRGAISDAEGRTRATAVLPGTYTLRLRASGCAVVRETLELQAEDAPWVRQTRLPAGC